MNPLCCIAPVSIDRDRANPVAAKSTSQCQLGLDSSVRTVNGTFRSSSYAPDSSHDGGTGGDSARAISGGNHEDDEAAVEPRESKVFGGGNGVAGSVAGILYKWVNYGKGWRSCSYWRTVFCRITRFMDRTRS